MIDDFIPWVVERKLNLVQVQTTSVCNATCIMCPYGKSWYKNNPGYMNDKLYTKILNDIAEYDPEFSGKFCPYLCNEPFADKNIIKRTQLAYDILKNPYIEFSSNMELLNHNKIDELYNMFENNKFYGKFTISHHGIDKESFEHTMKIDYDKSYDNMIYLLKKFQGKMKVTIQDMAYSLDAKYQINKYRQVKRYIENILDDNGIDRQKLLYEPKVFHNRAGNVDIEGWDYNRIIRKIDKNNPFNCLRIQGCLHIIYTGECIGCCMDYFRETILGDLNKISIKEFYKSQKWKDWVDMVRGDKDSPDDFICKRCMSPGG